MPPVSLSTARQGVLGPALAALLASCASPPPPPPAEPPPAPAVSASPSPPAPAAAEPAPRAEEPSPAAPAAPRAPADAVPLAGATEVTKLPSFEDNVWTVEGAVLVARASAEGASLERVQGATIEKPGELQAGLPQPDQRPSAGGIGPVLCGTISGLFGRHPDALWLTVSFAGRSCGSVFGTSKLYRLKKSGWAEIPLPRLAPGNTYLVQRPEWSVERGAAFSFDNAVGDSPEAAGFFVPNLPANAPDAVLSQAKGSRMGPQAVLVPPSGPFWLLGLRRPSETVFVERLGQAPRATTPPTPELTVGPPAALLAGNTLVAVARDASGRRGPTSLVKLDGDRWKPLGVELEGEVLDLKSDGETLWMLTADAQRPLRVGPPGKLAAMALPDGLALPAMSRIVQASHGEALVMTSNPRALLRLVASPR